MFEDPPMTPEQRKGELEDVRHEPLLAQLRDDIRTEVARDLPNFSDQEKEFADIDSQNLLLIYMNWRYRQIHPHARTIVYSVELSQRIRTDDALYAPVKSEFKELTRMIATGEDLLSRNLLSSRIVRKPYELTPNYSKLKREEHLDLLLNEQGIHHLHLPGLERKRGTPILFAIFEPVHAFLLDLASHDDYQTDRLARISYGNWPERQFRKIPADTLLDGQGSKVDLKDHERIAVRNNAINTPIKITDRLFVMPSSVGMMANGFAERIARRSTDIWNSLSLFAIRRYRPRFSEYFLETMGKQLPEDPVFRFRFLTTETAWEYAIVEEKSNCAFLLPNSFGVTKCC